MSASSTEISGEISGRQRLAWVTLAASFLVCMLIGLAVPVAANAFIQNATLDLATSIQANQGTVGIDDDAGMRRAVIAGETDQAVEPDSSILTDATASAFLLISSPTTEQLLARLNIDNNSTVHLHQATMPRFDISDAEQVVELELESGSLRATLLEDQVRPVVLQLTTPHGTVAIRKPGQYAVAVDNQGLQVAVQEGEAVVEANGETLSLFSGQRSEVALGGGPRGPLSPERNLIKNGDFADGFTQWSEYAWKVELSEEPKGRTEIITVDGEPVLRFARSGVGHADARVRQSLNANVVSYESLRLLLTLRVMEQSLGVCGVQGSECPLFVRVNYVDHNGVNQIWQHGFYASGEVDDNTTPSACVSCAVIQSNHERVPLAQDYFYEVDFIDELARQGTEPPRMIESVSLVASGHSFVTDVVDVALIAE